MRSVQKSELIILVVAIIGLLVAVVGHLAGASFANSDAFGIIAAPVPLILALISVIAYKYAAAHDEDTDH